MTAPDQPDGASALTPYQREFLADIRASQFYQWCGTEVLSVERGESKVRFSPRSEMLAPWGTLNGSLLNALLELPSFLALLPDFQCWAGHAL